MDEQKCQCGEKCNCGENCNCSEDCHCRHCQCHQWHKKPKFILKLVGIILLAGIVIISILRDRIVNHQTNQVTVWGEGKVTYAPDEAIITLGVEVDNIAKVGDAASQLNDKIGKIISAETGLGIAKEDITTDSYNLNPQYSFSSGTQTVSGYTASEHLMIKVRNVQTNSDLPGKVISSANDAGANQVLGVSYDISNPNDLKQQARLAAIADAQKKAADLFQAAGMKPGKIIGWTENNVYVPGPQPLYDSAMSAGAPSAGKAVIPAQVPAGTQDITVDVGVNYEVN